MQGSVSGAGVDPPCHIVGVCRRLRETQYRRKTDITAFQHGAPMRTRMACKKFGEAGLQRGPVCPVVLFAWIHVVKTEFVQQQGIELRLDGAQRNEAAFGTRIDVVKKASHGTG